MKETKRAQWDSGLLFIFTCVGYAVGLGNIWRFPSLAYENGGGNYALSGFHVSKIVLGAFLIPYLTCSMLIGFPMLYLEMSLGQFSNSGPAVVYGRIRPLFQGASCLQYWDCCSRNLLAGVGWAMAGISLMVSIYYNVIVAWVLLYLFVIITGRSYQWASCRNEFNTICKLFQFV